MNITFLLSHLKKQGPNTQFLYLTAELRRLGCDVRVVTFRKSDGDDLRHLYEKFGVEVLNLADLKFFKKYKILIQRLGSTNIICSYGLPADALSFLIAPFKGRVSFVRNQLFRSYWYTRGGWGIVYGIINYLILASCRHVFSCSEAVKEYLDKYHLQSITVRNSLNLKVFPELLESYAVSGTNYRSIKNKTKKNQFVFLTVSSTLKGKNTEFLLENFFSYEGDDRLLVVLGPVDEFMKKTYKSANIIFIGYDPNIYAHFMYADYFISASLHEGLPNTVLEACYFGVPCILSDIPEHLEVIGDTTYGICGLKFKLNEDDLNETLAQLRSHDYDQMSESAALLVRSNFCTVRSAEKFLGTLKESL